MLLVADPELRIRHVNRAACAELQYEPADFDARPLRELFGPEEFTENASLPDLLAPGIECSMQDKSGAPIPVHCSAARMNDPEGNLAGYVCVASNISRQKEAETQLLTSLKEKELLLKEVHHRVKNNLQVISSLLSLQASELQDPDAVRLFQESQGRVRSMALIHEQLYRSSDLARIDFAAYVQDLVSHLRRGLGSDASQVRFRLDIQPFPLSLDLAIPCGMIVNELVSNAQKHAFPDGQPGEIRVAFDRDSDGYCLTVADNGVGIQNGLSEEEPSSLGLTVVQALIRQIRGQVGVRQDQGTIFTIRFK
jgi:PAS domain S-box-containing protein